MSNHHPTPTEQHEKLLEKINDDRLVRYEAGETLIEIAEKDGISIESVASSIKDIEKRIDFSKLRELRVLKFNGAISNEKIRNQYRKDLAAANKKAIKALLSSTDDKSKAEGVRLYLKVVSLEEKPTAPTTTVNVQQTNANISESSGPPQKMEERIARIRKMQLEAHKVIDVEPVPEKKPRKKKKPARTTTRKENRGEA
jgi:hypothetical protein